MTSGFVFVLRGIDRAEEWKVWWRGKVLPPSFESKGAAEAYLSGLRSGRNPS